MASYETRSYPGGAPETVLLNPLNAAGLSFTVALGTGTGYPTGGSGPFYVIIDYDNSLAEKIRVTSRSGDTFTIPASDGRGSDGTTAVDHGVNAKVRAVWTATDAQEANTAAAQTVGKIASKGDLIVGSGLHTAQQLPVGANGTVPVANSAVTAGINWRGLTEADIQNLVADLAAKVALSLVTTKGDLLAATAASTLARLAVGTNGQVLTADSTQTAGVKWATGAGGVTIGNAVVATAQSTSSTTYTDLATSGPAVTITPGTTGIAVVFVAAGMGTNSSGALGKMSFAASGGNTVAAADSAAVIQSPPPTTVPLRASALSVLTGLAGTSTTFTSKYAESGGTITFSDRVLVVLTF